MVTNVAAAISNSESAVRLARLSSAILFIGLRIEPDGKNVQKHQIILCRISLYPAECLLLSGQFCRLMLAHAL